MQRSLRILGVLVCYLLALGTLAGCHKEEQFPPLVDEAKMCFVLAGDPDCFERYYDDVEASLDYMRQLCSVNQEYLIAVVTAFPRALQDHGFDTVDPQELDWWLDFKADEEATAADLLAVLDEILADNRLSVEFGTWQGSASLLYIFVRDAEAELTSANYGLMPVPACIDGHPTLCLTYTYADGTEEVGYFDLYTGFQRILPSKTTNPG